jgi:putative redox protein
MENQEVKEYSNGEVTVVWQAHKCTHSANCVKGLPQVFNAKAKPWINIEGADSQAIANQVKKCPSGALSYYYNKDKVD